jgi:3-phosphoshikimate 1-carboxyvinyltransferase
MNVHITPRRFTGVVKVPASKSHTIRQLLIASLADGVSEIKNPLDSLDTHSCIETCRAFGAGITAYQDNDNIIYWKVRGINAFKQPAYQKSISNFTENSKTETPDYSKDNNSLCDSGLPDEASSQLRSIPSPLKDAKINVGNSGTTLFFALAIAGLQEELVLFTGDEQIQKRSATPLLDALAVLGVQSKSSNGCAPITIQGPWKGGKVILPCPTSQYLSALLIAAPLAPAGTVTEIEVPLLNEKPYVEMTLSYLKAHNIPFDGVSRHFIIPGGSSWKAFSSFVPADFSSAAFPAAAAVITCGKITLLGLDPQDTQGDKFFFEMLKTMGCDVEWHQTPLSVTVSRSKPLCGGIFDLNETPDLLPAAAAVAAFAEGDTAFVNVAHARIKETDRIAVMAKELAKLGVNCTERPDGLIVHGKGGLFPITEAPIIDGHGDHRIVMAFAAIALGSPVSVEITDAECAAVTYPGFLKMVSAE